jgi:hypothetical protein
MPATTVSTSTVVSSTGTPMTVSVAAVQPAPKLSRLVFGIAFFAVNLWACVEPGSRTRGSLRRVHVGASRRSSGLKKPQHRDREHCDLLGETRANPSGMIVLSCVRYACIKRELHLDRLRPDS